eukprot:1158366-Pelagomonas_calceolata.AAC.6
MPWDICQGLGAGVLPKACYQAQYIGSCSSSDAAFQLGFALPHDIAEIRASVEIDLHKLPQVLDWWTLATRSLFWSQIWHTSISECEQQGASLAARNGTF